MIRTGGKTLRALEHVDALGRKSPRQTVQYVQLQRGSARTQLCVRLSSCVQNCPLRSETAGCWLVCQGRRRAGKWVCVCVCVWEFICVYTPASIWFQQGSLCNLHRATRLMMAAPLWFVSYAWVFPSLPPLRRSHQRSCQGKKGGITHLRFRATSTHSPG